MTRYIALEFDFTQRKLGKYGVVMNWDDEDAHEDAVRSTIDKHFSVTKDYGLKVLYDGPDYEEARSRILEDKSIGEAIRRGLVDIVSLIERPA